MENLRATASVALELAGSVTDLIPNNPPPGVGPKRRPLGFGWLLFGLIGAVYVFTVLMAFALGGFASGMAALFAAFVCLVAIAVGELLGLMLTGGSENLTARYFAGMLPRVGMPLAAAIGVSVAKGPLYEAGVIFYLLGFYLVALFSETITLASHMTRPTS